jgi:hypothetical protein
MYVLDMMSQDVRVFRADGGFSHRFGAMGSGPGEFRDASGMTFGQGDTLWVLDAFGARYSAFDRQGTFIRTVPRRILRGGDASGHFLPDGRYLDWGVQWSDGSQNSSQQRLTLHPIALGPGFEGQDTLAPIEYDQPLAMIGGELAPAVYFSPRVATTVDGAGRLWFAHTESYRLYRRTLQGDTTLVVTVAAEPVPVGDAGREYVRQRTARMPALTADYLKALPESRPIVHRIFSDGSGHIFVLVDVAGHVSGSVLDVFLEEGQYLGRLLLPEPVALLPPSDLVVRATPTHLIVVVPSLSGAPYLSRLRIIRRGTGA